MDRKEKIDRLNKEIEELRQKKEEKESINQLFAERNRLKFPLLYKAGGFLKDTGKGIANWADAKNKELEEDKMKQKKQEKKQNHKKSKNKPEEDSEDLVDALFGETEINKQFNKQLGV